MKLQGIYELETPIKLAHHEQIYWALQQKKGKNVPDSILAYLQNFIFFIFRKKFFPIFLI
jgi:hypothetical protein